MEGFPLGRECKPHEKSHKQMGIIFTCCVHLMAVMLFLSMGLCTFLAEVTKVSVLASRSTETVRSRRLPGGIVLPLENLGCSHCQEKNGNEAVAGPEKSMSNSGKQPGPGRNHWSWLGPLCAAGRGCVRMGGGWEQGQVGCLIAELLLCRQWGVSEGL